MRSKVFRRENILALVPLLFSFYIYFIKNDAPRWALTFQGVSESKEVLFKVLNRYEQIYRQASMRFLTASNELAKLGALNIMLKANSLVCETAVLPEVLGRLKELEDKAKHGVFVP